MEDSSKRRKNNKQQQKIHKILGMLCGQCIGEKYSKEERCRCTRWREQMLF